MREEIFIKELACKFKNQKQDFTITKKQSFGATLLFVVNMLRRSLVIEIDSFVSHLSHKLSKAVPCFTASAFIQNPRKINPEVFKHLSTIIIENLYTNSNEDLKLLKGMRILASDCSVITLRFTQELRERYGVASNAATLDVVQARISALYDVLLFSSRCSDR